MGRASNVLRWPGGREGEDDEPTDITLVDRCRAAEGREEAAELLYRRHGGKVLALFRRLDLPIEVSQDLTQETFAKAFEKLDSFRGDSAFGTWLHQIARNLGRRYLRDGSAKKRSGHHVPIDESNREDSGTVHAALLEDEQAGPELRLIENERLAKLRHAIDQLPASRRQMLRLRLAQNCSDQEIATLLKIPVGTVKSRMSDIRRTLRELLADAYPSLRSGS